MQNKTAIIALAGVLVLGFLGGWLGRGATPGTVTEHTVETRLQTQVVNNTYKVDVAELNRLIADQFAKLQKNVKVDTTTTKLPDGTEVTHTVSSDTSTSESGSHTDSSASRTASSSGSSSSATTDLKVDDRFKQVTGSGVGPRWGLGVLAVYQPIGAAPTYSLLPNERLMVAVTLEHRLIGPLWVGGAVTSTLAVGGSLKLVW